MKERRKRRSAKDIEESILDAANQLIENDGFSKLTVIWQKSNLSNSTIDMRI